MKNVFIPVKHHLGDVIFLLNLLHNYAIKHDENFKVHGSSVVHSLMEIFDYKATYGSTTLNGAELKIENLIQDWWPGFAWDHSSPFQKHTLVRPSVKYSLPEKQEFTCFQFDARSNSEFKKKLSTTECLTAIQKFNSTKTIVGIGGTETIPYLNYKFIVGDLDKITKTLLSCHKFIGVDSGMSHLAGTLQVKSDIIVQDIRPHQIKRIIDFTCLMYPTIKCHPREIKII